MSAAIATAVTLARVDSVYILFLFPLVSGSDSRVTLSDLPRLYVWESFRRQAYDITNIQQVNITSALINQCIAVTCTQWFGDRQMNCPLRAVWDFSSMGWTAPFIIRSHPATKKEANLKITQTRRTAVLRISQRNKRETQIKVIIPCPTSGFSDWVKQ